MPLADAWARFLTFILIQLLSYSFFLEGTAAAYAFTSVEGDLPASIAIMWSLCAIFAHQTEPFSYWTSLAFAILSALWVVKGIWGVYSRFTRGAVLLEDDERGPLRGGRVSIWSKFRIRKKGFRSLKTKRSRARQDP